jgi:PDZ domain-containing secreted protein
MKRNVGIAALVIGLVIGLALGIFVTIFLNLPSPSPTSVSNLVQVSGTVSETQTGYMEFTTINQPANTRILAAIIVNGQYSVLLLGDQSYNVHVYVPSYTYAEYTFKLYVPPGVTTFTANF